MKIALAVVQTVGEYDSSMDCDYAVINLECPSRFKHLLAQAGLLGDRIGALRGIEIWDQTPDIISLDDVARIFGEAALEEADSAHDNRTAFVLDASEDALAEVANASERTEGSVMHVSSEEIYWSFYPKHTTVTCETDAISGEILDSLD